MNIEQYIVFSDDYVILFLNLNNVNPREVDILRVQENEQVVQKYFNENNESILKYFDENDISNAWNLFIKYYHMSKECESEGNFTYQLGDTGTILYTTKYMVIIKEKDSIIFRENNLNDIIGLYNKEDFYKKYPNLSQSVYNDIINDIKKNGKAYTFLLSYQNLEWDIFDVCVDNNYRNNKWGTKLTRGCIDFVNLLHVINYTGEVEVNIEEKKIIYPHRIQLFVRPENKFAVRAYLNAGYTDTMFQNPEEFMVKEFPWWQGRKGLFPKPMVYLSYVFQKSLPPDAVLPPDTVLPSDISTNIVLNLLKPFQLTDILISKNTDITFIEHKNSFIQKIEQNLFQQYLYNILGGDIINNILITNDKIIEIKYQKEWKQGVINLLNFNRVYPGKEMILYLYKEKDEQKEEIQLGEEYKIKVFFVGKNRDQFVYL